MCIIFIIKLIKLSVKDFDQFCGQNRINKMTNFTSQINPQTKNKRKSERHTFSFA